MADGRHIGKHRFWQRVIRFSRNFYENAKSENKWRKNVKIFQIRKYKMADDHHLENGYITIFQCNVVKIRN